MDTVYNTMYALWGYIQTIPCVNYRDKYGVYGIVHGVYGIVHGVYESFKGCNLLKGLNKLSLKQDKNKIKTEILWISDGQMKHLRAAHWRQCRAILQILGECFWVPKNPGFHQVVKPEKLLRKKQGQISTVRIFNFERLAKGKNSG